MDTLQLPAIVSDLGSDYDTVHELGNVLNNTLQVKDKSYNSDLPPGKDGSSIHVNESVVPNECDENLDCSIQSSSKCLQKCATFPAMGTAEEKTPNLILGNNACSCSHSHSISLPTVRKLVSALKGSREKEGREPLKNVSVTWAPDVYDPPPTSVSHYPKKKTQNQFKSNKKHGKGKQKGKNKSYPKDKKHHRKTTGAGTSDRCLDLYSNTDRVKSSSNQYKSSVIGQLDFEVNENNDIGGRESNCGSSYRGKACSTVHYAYAEAT